MIEMRLLVIFLGCIEMFSLRGRTSWLKRPCFRVPLCNHGLQTSAASDNVLHWENEDSIPKIGVDEDGSPSLAALAGFANPVKVDVDDLVEKWIKACLDKGIAPKRNEFTLKKALPLVLTPNYTIELVNNTQVEDSSVTFVTEEELRRIWRENMHSALGKPMDKYVMEEAILLLEDEGTDDNLGADSEGLRGEGGVEAESKRAETTVTLQELERLWNARSNVPWGLPSKSFDEELALMLMDSDDDIECDSVSAPCTDEAEGNNSSELDAKEEDLSIVNAVNKKFPGRDNQPLIEALKRVRDNLDSTDSIDQAQQLRRSGYSFLTPDVDSQIFMGDIMQSNSYLTTRIPANWNDPEASGMPEFYNDASTMALPGEEETNYNDNRPLWEMFDLPIGPGRSKGKGLVETLREKSARDNGLSGTSAMQSPMGINENGKVAPENVMSTKKRVSKTVDWTSFDFSAAEEGEIASTGSTDNVGADDGNQFHMEGGRKSVHVDPEELSLNSSVDIDDLSPEEYTQRRKDLFERNSVGGVSCVSLTEPPFIASESVRAIVEDPNYVGYDMWSKYGPNEGFDCDNLVWDEDVYMIQAARHLKEVTDLYLDDHQLAVAYQDQQKNLSRVLSNAFFGTNITKEPIPRYLTPDIDRGIAYSDEIIEMKGKRTLHPLMIDPSVEWANDTFTHNEDIMAMNIVGTIREQYDWLPRQDLKPYLIESDKVEKLQPVIEFINFAGELLSTKDDIIVFKYKGGIIRHIVGLRYTMLAMARKCYPEVKDLRLESTITCDKFDGC